jgi:hypothetical protein
VVVEFSFSEPVVPALVSAPVASSVTANAIEVGDTPRVAAVALLVALFATTHS